MMRLAYVEMSGFRGYSKPVRIDFARRFTVIDGRNGVGKSSVFDAIEYALLGRLTKYEGAKADQESADDYVWWRGEGALPAERYVEVGFEDDERLISVRRTMLKDPPAEVLDDLATHLMNETAAPSDALAQLFRNSIIRDEHIAALSLDLKETQRYQVLCDAIGALGSDEWAEKAARLLSESQRRVRIADAEVQQAISSIQSANSRLADIDAAAVAPDRLRDATVQIQRILGTTQQGSELVGSALAYAANQRVSIEKLHALLPAIDGAEADRERSKLLTAEIEQLRQAFAHETAEYTELAQAVSAEAEDEPEAIAELAQLLALGRQLGPQDGHCPLCNADHSPESFSSGLSEAEARLGRLREIALARAQQRRALQEKSDRLAELQRTVDAQEIEKKRIDSSIARLHADLAAQGLSAEATTSDVLVRISAIEENVVRLTEHLPPLQGLATISARPSAAQAVSDARTRHVRAEEKLGIARKAEGRAKALHDAVRRAAGDALNSRLNQILPLTSELYQRLRPHPVWDDIAYKLRGDVKRFLKLEVGEEINPQFVFSSGQRRATGLAFLLSVQLSLSWSRFNTLMLDDPVQHIDDFRSVHLAEVLSKLVASGKQIICAAEDAALADLIARRLPSRDLDDAKRITLGVSKDGQLDILESREVSPMPIGTFIPMEFKTAS